MEVLQRCFGSNSSDWYFARTIDHVSETTELSITYDLFPALTIEIYASDIRIFGSNGSLYPSDALDSRRFP